MMMNVLAAIGIVLQVGVPATSQDLAEHALGAWVAVAESAATNAGPKKDPRPFEIVADRGNLRLKLRDKTELPLALEYPVARAGDVGPRPPALLSRRSEVIGMPVGTATVEHVETYSLQADGTLLRVTESSDGRQTVRVSQVYKREAK